MKKVTVFIIAILVVAQFYSLNMIKRLDNDLMAARREIAHVDNEVEAIYDNVNEQMKREASRIFAADTEIVDVDLENVTAEVLFTVQPKEVAENTKVYLRIEDEEFALTKDNLTYTAKKSYPLAKEALYPVVIIENDGVRYSEKYTRLNQSIRDAVLLEARASFGGQCMTSVNRYQENGTLTVHWAKKEINEGREIYFTKMDYVVKVDDVEIDRLPFVMDKTSGMVELEVLTEYEVKEGQVITTWLEAEDNLGLYHTYRVHQQIVGDANGRGAYPLEKVTVVNDKGTVVYEYEESEEW